MVVVELLSSSEVCVSDGGRIADGIGEVGDGDMGVDDALEEERMLDGGYRAKKRVSCGGRDWARWMYCLVEAMIVYL